MAMIGQARAQALVTKHVGNLAQRKDLLKTRIHQLASRNSDRPISIRPIVIP